MDEEKRVNSIESVLISQGEMKQMLLSIKENMSTLSERVGTQNGRVSNLELHSDRHGRFIGTVQRIAWICIVPILGGFIGFIWWGIVSYAQQ